MNVPKTETEAREAITEEHFRAYTDAGGRRHVAMWELRTPDGWCWEQGRHLNVCFSKKQAKTERASEPIERCEPGCVVCNEEAEDLPAQPAGVVE